MVGRNAEAPEPPEASREPGEAPAAPPIIREAEDSDDETMDQYDGYEPLPLAPFEEGDIAMWDSRLVSSDSEDDEFEPAEPPEENTVVPPQSSDGNVPFIESVDREVTREVWTAPREEPNIRMDPEKAQQVMLAMANFSLPPSSFPDWAHSISEEEWRCQLARRINPSQDNR